MANTYSLMQVWQDRYEITHFKQPIFRAFAEEKFTPDLQMGATFNREYASDLVVNAMGANGSYSTQAFTNTLDTGTVNIKEESSVQIIEWQKLQDHLPTQMKYTTKNANALWLQVDAAVIGNMSVNAASVVDDGVINGSAGVSGNAVSINASNVQQLFWAAIQELQLLNVDYEPNKSLAKDVKLEEISNALVAAISPQTYTLLLQYIGGKTTVLGDNISRNGHLGMFAGFNLFVSNQLMWEGQLVLATQPSNGDTFTLLNGVTVNSVSQALTFTYVSSIGSTAGNILEQTNATTTATNTKNGLNAPYTTTSTFVGFTQSALTTWQQKLLYNLTATIVATNILDVKINGGGNVPVAQSMTAAGNVWTAAQQKQHQVFGTSKSVSLLMQSNPHLFVNPVSGQVARDLVSWDLYGIKTFYDQTFQLVDVQVASSSFGASGTPINQFN